MDFTQMGPTVQMHGWYLQGRRRAVTWTWAFPGTRLLEEPEEKGHRAWRAAFRGHSGSSPEPLLSAFHPPLPTGPRGGASWCLQLGGFWKGAGEGPSDSNAGRLDYTSPSPRTLGPKPAHLLPVLEDAS